PRVLGPVPEREVGEARERELRLHVDPEEGAAPAEVAERAHRVELPGPVRALRAADLESEPPVVRLHPPVAGEHAVEAGELNADSSLPGRSGEACRFVELARDDEQVVERA